MDYTDNKMLNDVELCPQCSITIKSRNLKRHLRKVHGIGTMEAKKRAKWEGIEKQVKKQHQSRRRKNFIRYSSISFIAVIIIGFFLLNYNNENKGSFSPAQQAQQTGNDVIISISEISTNAKFYSFDHNGINVRFFAVEGSDGNAHVAFDACDVCYGEKRGYRQVGEVMHCNNCGQEFAINSIGTENLQGGCWPSYLAISYNGNNVVIKNSDIIAKSDMF